MKRIVTFSLLLAALALLLSVGISTAEKEAKMKPLSLAKLTEKIEKLEKKDVVLAGTIVGVCKSGCKMWVSDGEYKKGDPFALVRAKDDAFKFDKDATGQKVILHGIAIAKYLDYCAESGDEQEGAMDKCATPVETADAKVKDGDKKGKTVEVTFFATKVAYKEAKKDK